MKKQMKWLLAALALAALATPAFALNADMTGTLAVRGIANNNLDGNDDVQDHGKWVDQRFRLFTSVAANENVKAVLGLEVDNVWGRVAQPAVKEVGAVGADAGVGATAVIEVKHLYLDFKIPSLGTNVKAGTQPVNFGRGLVINDDAAALVITQPCPVFPDNKLEISWIKTSEGAAANIFDNPATPLVNEFRDASNDEGDFYGAKYTMKVAGIAIAPYAGYYQNDFVSTSTFNDGVEAAFFGVDVDGKAGPFGYAATAIYNNWTNGPVDGDSVSLYGKGTLGLGATNLSLEAGLMGDEDNQGGNAMNLAQSAANGPLQNISEILTGGMYTANAGPQTNIGGAGGASNLYLTNWLYVKAGVVQKLTDAMQVSAYVAHIQQGADVGTTDKITFGQEVDAYFDYTIVPGLGLNLMAAYLLADDDFGPDNAYKLGSSLNYKF
jgi:hypothetical protein